MRVQRVHALSIGQYGRCPFMYIKSQSRILVHAWSNYWVSSCICMDLQAPNACTCRHRDGGLTCLHVRECLALTLRLFGRCPSLCICQYNVTDCEGSQKGFRAGEGARAWPPVRAGVRARPSQSVLAVTAPLMLKQTTPRCAFGARLPACTCRHKRALWCVFIVSACTYTKQFSRT